MGSPMEELEKGPKELKGFATPQEAKEKEENSVKIFVCIIWNHYKFYFSVGNVKIQNGFSKLGNW